MIAFFDVFLPYWVYLVTIIVILYIIAISRHSIRLFLKTLKLSKLDFLLVIGAFLLISSALVLWVPFQPRVQSDESLFLSTAQNMYHNSLSGSCEEGIFHGQTLDCIRETHLFKGKLWAFILSMALPYFQEPKQAVIACQLCLWVLSWITLYLLVCYWIRPSVAFLTCILLFTQPIVLQQYGAGDNGPLYIFLGSLSFLALLYVKEKVTPSALILLGSILSLWLQTRQETIFILPLFAIVLFNTSLVRINPKFFLYFLIPLLLFSSPIFTTLLYFRNFDLQSGSLSTRGHFFENIQIAMHRIFYPPYQAPFILLGLGAVIFLAFTSLRSVRIRKHSLVLIFALLPAWVIFEHIGGDMTINSNHRYSLTWLPHLSFLIAFALGSIPFLSRKRDIPFYLVSASLTLIALGLGKPVLQNNIPYNDERYLQEQREIRFFISNSDFIEKPLFVYTRPSHFIADGYSALYTGSIARNDMTIYKDIIDQWKGPKYLVWGADCQGNTSSHTKVKQLDLQNICSEAVHTLELSSHAIWIGNTQLFQINALRRGLR